MAAHHGLRKIHGIEAYCNGQHQRQRGDRFGRLFTLPALYTPATALDALGAIGGPLDAKGKTKARTRTVPVGQIFFGQFVDHDITLDVTTSLSSVVGDPTTIENVRTPTLDLDCIYSEGPEASPFLYHGDGEFKGIKLLVGADGTAADQKENFAKNDLIRTSDGTAIIGDPRNDENRIISQLQLAMLRFHNNVVDQLSTRGEYEGAELFEEARKTVTWHYQWAIIHDFLPAVCGASVVADILGNGRKIYCSSENDAFIPVEFSVAAYRFGHSMIPQDIKIQKGKDTLPLFGKILGNGFSPLSSAKAVVDWKELFKLAKTGKPQMAEKLDSKLASKLLDLPFIDPPNDRSLASRNLHRGQAFLLPSGENVARKLERPDAEIKTVSTAANTLAGTKADLSNGTPLWLYLLLEAEKIGRACDDGKGEKGEGLGPVGAQIVAETMLGLIELDSRSFLAMDRSWTPDKGVGVSSVGGMLTYSAYPA